ncbi:hypothetical protein CYMTET_34424 [Cymbomonas tetramitiformis]|uniref:Uncharacterized protein n=1 Tax=Cymbomonas tetramitiformis TaxID=36881 RepID=A0AAE0KPZ4_9CHLO|nr:hypothetical protein CYMTET_34424 [Cymbomonas tetramitiformis]
MVENNERAELTWKYWSPDHPEVCGNTYNLGLQGGCEQLNWYGAYERCESAGARLCSQNDILAGAGSGCGYYEVYLWTYTPCEGTGDGPFFLTVWGSYPEKSLCRPAWDARILSAHFLAPSAHPADNRG